MEQIKRKRTIYEVVFKRPLDFIFSLIAIIVLSPIMFIVGILVKIKLGGSFLFKQERPGKNGKIFTMYKFKTMLDAKTFDGKVVTDSERLKELSLQKNENDKSNIVSDSERITKFGRLLRSTSLDELPELYNILKGDMSFVGPRPLSTIYLPYYTEEENQRHSVRPGLTGLAQVNGRNNISWEERFKYDLRYVNKVTFTGDLKIFFKTIIVSLKRTNIGDVATKPVAFHIERQNKINKQKEKENFL